MSIPQPNDTSGPNVLLGSFVGLSLPGATLQPGWSGLNPSLVSTGPRSFEHEYATVTFSCGLAHFANGPVRSAALPRPSQFDYPATTNTS